jgi:hypothetical protein
VAGQGILSLSFASFHLKSVRGNWPSRTIRVLAVLNFVFAGIGLLVSGLSVLIRLLQGHENTAGQPYFEQAFWAMTSINYAFLGLLILGGVLLWHRKRSGVVLCTAVFVTEILYFLAIGYIWGAGSEAFAGSVAAATGVANGGVTPQVICGYPLVAIILLNIAYRRIHST